ncbi:MAG: Pathogenicity locus [Fibrobacteria bacterium]|jgi:hypothetical protein|nr:Pathogenicity locus [Fibrobacteria bacterium]
MNLAKMNRSRLEKLTDLPNIGPACARDLQRLGFSDVEDREEVAP